MDALASVEPSQGRTVRAAGRDIFVTEIGEGPPLLMLHGGGPGASGLSNFVRNIPALAERFRLIVPDMPGFGRSTKGIDRKDPFGDLATAMLGLIDALGVERTHALGNSLGGACALRMALEAPARVDRLVLLGPGGDRQQPPPADRGPSPPARLLFGRRPDPGEVRDVPAQGSRLRRSRIARRADRRALRREPRSGSRREPAARAAEGLVRRPRPHARSSARRAE